MQSVLLAALALTAAVWLSAGYFFARRVRALQQEVATISERYAVAESALGEVRQDVDRAVVTLRNALIDVGSDRARYADDIDAALDSAEAMLAGYSPVVAVDSDRQHVDRLRQNINAIRLAYHDLLATGTAGATGGTAEPGKLGVSPDAVMRTSADLQRLNRDAFLAHQAEMARVQGLIHERTWQTLIFGALAATTIGLGATLRVGRLERELRARQRRDAANAEAIQGLSTRLVNAQEAERRRLARELHDGVGQLLTALKFELTQAERGAAGEVPLGEARALTAEALTAVRDVSHLLHPPELEQLGLVEAVKAFVRMVSRRQAVAIEFTTTDRVPRLPPMVELALYRIVQEAVTNVLRHARAEHCRVSLNSTSGRLVLTVSDDGVGFPPSPGPGALTPGLGLTGIHERALHAGGSVEVESAPGRGTTLKVEIPIQNDDGAAVIGATPVLSTVHSI